MATYLRGQNAVDSVQDIKKTVDQMVTVISVLRTGGPAVLVIVGLIVLFIIVNTIRLAVVARAQEIEIMRLVGASDAFIRWPFIFEGALVGFFGAAITIVLLLGGSGVRSPACCQPTSTCCRSRPARSSGQNVAAIVLVTGVGIGVLGSYLSVRSYLTR